MTCSHVSFGAVGPHFRPGAQLARLESVAILRELLGRLPGIRSVGENFVQRITCLKYEF